MFNRIILELVFSAVQVALYYLVMRICWNIGSIFHEPTHRDIASGLTLIFSVYAFGAVVTVQNVIDAIVNRKPLSTWLLIFAAMVFGLLWIYQWNDIPLRIILIVSAGLLVLLLKFFFLRLLLKSSRFAQGIEAESPQR